jgi:peptidoglycan hydrolase-like protein with peptidoglycan-binding domain
MVDYNKMVDGIPRGSNMNDRAYAKAQAPQKTLVRSSPQSKLLQRTCACGGSPGIEGLCTECRDKRLSLRSTQRGFEAPFAVHTVLNSGGGQPLDATTRAFMEPRFGHDFSQVRVHTDARAAESARAVSALAYTVGKNVVFGAGHYAPETSVGQRLLAHELTHVVQQQKASNASLQGKLTVSQPNNAHEHEAEAQAAMVMEGGRASESTDSPDPSAKTGDHLTSPRFAGDRKLEACYQNRDRLREGDHGESVVKIQQALVYLGYNLGTTGKCHNGVDGVYGPKTAAAVRSFKKDNHLGFEEYGDVGPGTMHRLNVLFPATTPQPTITHETTFSAPDGTDKKRTNVGVGEEVTFTGSAVGKWTATNGTPRELACGAKFTWTAPDRAATVTIKLQVGTEEATVSMKVIEPASITGHKNSEIAFAAGTAGAGMKLTFIYHPRNISFGNVKAKEVSGPATNITGYYRKHFTNARLKHNSGDLFTPIKENNEDSAEDTASDEEHVKPYEKGTFDWVIPNNFRVKAEAGDGKQFTRVTQAFLMVDATGKIKITKAGVDVERSPTEP